LQRVPSSGYTEGMEIPSLPPNVYHRLMLVGGSMIMVNAPLPGGEETDPKVLLIIFTPAKTDSSLLVGEDEDAEPDGETRWTVPAKYHLLMREADGSLGDEVQIHEIWADKVLVASRLASRVSAIDEFEALIREELGADAPVDLKNLGTKPNGQQTATTT
jgi:hypothetical protein